MHGFNLVTFTLSENSTKSTNFLHWKVCWQHPSMFCLCTLPAHNLNFSWRWRWWDWIQAIFLNIFFLLFNCSVAIVNPLDWKLVHPTFLQCTEGPLVTFNYILRNFTSLGNGYVCSTRIIKIEIQCSDVMSWFLFNPEKI